MSTSLPQMKPSLIVWGASSHALVVADIVRLCGQYAIVGFLDDLHPERHGAEFCGSHVIGGRERLDDLRREGVLHAIIAVGKCRARLELADFVREKGFLLAVAVHPGATIARSVMLGEGTVVAAGAVVNPGAVIGENVIINAAATVDHECVIGNGAHICPGAHLAGRVIVGRAAWVGVGATVVDGVRVGEHALVGAGAVVINDVPEGVVSYGVPARVVRRVADDDH